jgi:hypothetical protein
MVKRFQVIQGGKNREKSTRDETPRLFRAYSIGDFSKREMIYSEVKFNWYCLERSTTHIEYHMAIADYANLSDRDRKSLERTTDRYFADIEIQMLREYLASSFGLGLETEGISLPIREKGVLFDEGSSVIFDFLELSEKRDYRLPFKVWGYYTLEHSLSSPSLDNGIQLLRKTFEILGLSPPVTDEQMRHALSRIYRENGLFVKNRDRPSQP